MGAAALHVTASKTGACVAAAQRRRRRVGSPATVLSHVHHASTIAMDGDVNHRIDSSRPSNRSVSRMNITASALHYSSASHSCSRPLLSPSPSTLHGHTPSTLTLLLPSQALHLSGGFFYRPPTWLHAFYRCENVVVEYRECDEVHIKRV